MNKIARNLMSNNRILAGVIIIMSVSVGLYLLQASSAATGSLSFETENGVANGAGVIADSTASGGQAIKFGAAQNLDDPYSYAIPIGGLPMPANTTWRQRVDTAPVSDLYVDTASKVYSHAVPAGVVGGATLRQRFLDLRRINYGEVALNTEKYNIGFFNATGRNLPIKNVAFMPRDYEKLWATPETNYNPANGAHFTNAAFDPRMTPALGTDRSLAIYNNGQLSEYWQAYKSTELNYTGNNGEQLGSLPPPKVEPAPNGIGSLPSGEYYKAHEGGREPNTATAAKGGGFPNAKGSSAVGIPNTYGALSIQEARQIIYGFTDPVDPSRNVVATPAGGPVRADTGLRANGEPVINHAFNMALTDAHASQLSWPAQRHDGTDTSQNAIMEGLRLRLDPSLTSTQLATATSVDGKPITPIGKAIAESMKRYGIIITDKTYSSIIMTAESGELVKKLTGTNPWGQFQQPGRLTNGVGDFEILRGIPWDKLQFLKKDWGKF